jgi:hypothetical protein
MGSSLSGFSQEKNQSVIASAGDISKGGNVSLEWTLGELAVETAAGFDKIYTQGFHQPILITKLKPSNEVVTGYTVSIYPNPVPSILNIYIQSIIDSKVYLKLLDVKGRLVYNNSTYSRDNSVKIDMRAFASGVYFLMVIGPSGVTIGTYKIVKAS